MQLPEDWIKWVMAFHEIENLMPMKVMRMLEAEDSDFPDDEIIERVLRDVGLEYIPKRGIHVQKYYMRQTRGLYMGLNTYVQQFVERLNEINRCILNFP
jgi:hypothetical protein